MTNTSTNARSLLVVLAVLVAASAIAPAAATASLDSQSADARDARLAIDQPGYIDEDVTEESINGTRTYVASGDRLLIAPTNFQASDVVDYGVDEDEASLSYNSELDVFEFSPSAEGTYHVFFTVREDYAVTNTTANDTNTTESGSETETETETRRVRYEAAVRVDGAINTVHMSKAERDRLNENAELGATVNATMQDLREMRLPLVDNSVSDREMFQDMASLYADFGYPGAWLTGSLTGIIILLVSTLGGLLLLAATFLGFGRVIYKAKKRLNIYETTEADEGSLADRQAEIDEEERRKALQNIDWHDIYSNPSVADTMRDTLGDTPKDGLDTLLRTGLMPEVWIRDRLQAMGMVGWHARVHRDPTAASEDGDDGGGEEPGRIVDAELLDPDTTLEDVDGDVVAIRDELDALVGVLDWECESLREFNLAAADIDWGALNTTPVTMDAESLVSELDLQHDRFDDDEAPAQYLYEFIATVREHEFTDSEGDPETVRELLNDLLRGCQYYGDVAGLPGTEVPRQHIERALADYDRNERARQYSEEVRSGVV